MSNWEKVYGGHQIHRIEIVKSILEEHGLKPILLNKKDSNYLIGRFEIHVNSDEVLRAIKIIDDEVKFSE